MKTFIGTIKDGRFELELPQFRLREKYLKSLKDGTEVVETFKKKVKSKSWSQVKAHFGLALKLIVTAFDDRGWDSSEIYKLEKPNGVPVNEIMLQQYFYALFPTSNEEGKIITMSDPDFTTAHESVFFDSIRNHVASQWSIYIPDPEPNWKDKELT
jgi:hypothetical protein